MTNEDRLDFLIGQVAAMKAFCIASAVSHTNPSELLAAFQRGSEYTVAKTLPTVASEAMLQGMDSMNQDLLKVVQGESKRRGEK